MNILIPEHILPRIASSEVGNGDWRHLADDFVDPE